MVTIADRTALRIDATNPLVTWRDMIVDTFPVGALRCNCTILGCERTREAVVVDPGDEADRILDRLAELDLEARFILHTHAHFDHVMATRAIKEAHGALIGLHPADAPLYENLQVQATMFDVAVDAPVPVDGYLEDGAEIFWGEHDVDGSREATFSNGPAPGRHRGILIHTPGHTPGSGCLYVPELSLLLSGDTLFKAGFGRTDLWGGSFPDLVASIRERLFTLPPDTRVIPGHGPMTTIEAEVSMNPVTAM